MMQNQKSLSYSGCSSDHIKLSPFYQKRLHTPSPRPAPLWELEQLYACYRRSACSVVSGASPERMILAQNLQELTAGGCGLNTLFPGGQQAFLS